MFLSLTIAAGAGGTQQDQTGGQFRFRSRLESVNEAVDRAKRIAVGWSLSYHYEKTCPPSQSEISAPPERPLI